MPFSQGEVLVLPFPYADRLAERRRPAVVISKPALERHHGVLWVAMITSEMSGRRSHDTPISDLKRAGLPAASVVRATKLATIEPSRVLRSAGVPTKADLTLVLETIRKFT